MVNIERLKKSVNSIKEFSNSTPKTGIILGSGLSIFTDSVNGTEIPYNKIDGFPMSSVKGHKGSLKVNNNLAVMAGRFHFYEGHTIKDVVFPIFVLKELGIKNRSEIMKYWLINLSSNREPKKCTFGISSFFTFFLPVLWELPV